MKKMLAIALLTFSFSFSAFAGNFATCILKHMPGIQNDPAAYAATRLCMSEHPGGFASVQQGEGRGMLSYNSGAECAVKKGSGTTSRMAGQQIYNACNKLFNPPLLSDDEVFGRKKPWEEFARQPANPFDRFDNAPSAEQFLDRK